jgi:HEAT repeat protein
MVAMSNGDDADALAERLDEAATAVDDAATEADLDQVAATLEDIETDIEAADLPEPDDEDEEAPAEALESQLADVRDAIEDARGPYASDVTAALDDVAEELRDTEWTADGEGEATEAVAAFLAAAGETLETGMGSVGDAPADAADALDAAGETIEGAALDADDDAEAIADLLDATDVLADGVDDAEAWDDLTVREQLDAEGFYDVLSTENRKDFPPEWNAIKVYAERGEPEPILTALDRFESDFMEENALEAIERIAPAAALDAMIDLAGQRDTRAVRILGRIGDEAALDTIHEFVEGDGDVTLQRVTLRAIGAIGSPESTQVVADNLVADDDEVRSNAARALGLIGDPRAIDPLADVLAWDDADEVRGSAAWALNQIGTERALDIVGKYTDDQAYLVQAEAKKATSA